jgi:hydroxylamine reductase
MLGAVDETVDDYCEEVLAFLAAEESKDPAAVLGMCMGLGEVNLRVMQLLDGAHTGR